jgi:hypothetical protein
MLRLVSAGCFQRFSAVANDLLLLLSPLPRCLLRLSDFLLDRARFVFSPAWDAKRQCSPPEPRLLLISRKAPALHDSSRQVLQKIAVEAKTDLSSF